MSDEQHGAVSAFLEEGLSDDWHRPAKECSQFQAMLLRPRYQQIELVMALLVRVLWLFECRGPRAVASLYLCYEALKRLLARKLPFNDDQVAALVLLITTPTLARELGSSVLQQVRWTERPTAEPTRRALKRLKKVGAFAEAVQPLLSRERIVFPQTPREVQKQLERLTDHARRLPDEVSRRWWRKGRALCKDLGPEELERTLVPWLTRELAQLHHDHSRMLRGIVVLLGGETSDDVAHFLERVVKWGFRRRQGYGPQDFRLARSGIRALAKMPTHLALSYLVILGSELRYSRATEELLRVLRRRAQREGESLHTLVEVRTALWPPSSTLGKRLWRSHVRRLERCLRTGRCWSQQAWRESYVDSPLLGALGRKVIWQDDHGSFRWQGGTWRDATGVGHIPQGEVRLWHPAEASGEHWNDFEAIFAQAGREVYTDTDVRQKFLTKQYRLAALFRERDWSYRLVGRYRRRSEATLRLAGCCFRLVVERATSHGPYSRAGDSIEARVVALQSDLDWDRVPARIRSEVLRDFHLFRSFSAEKGT